MNLELKQVLATLDAHIAAVQTVRDLLAKVIAGESPAIPGVQTNGRVTESTVKPGKKKRGGRRKQRPEQESAEIAVASRPAGEAGTITGRPVSTVAGAMKLHIAGLSGKAFTADEIRQALEAKYGEEEWWKAASTSALSANLSYWTSKGRLEKTSDGYRAREKEFFQTVEC